MDKTELKAYNKAYYKKNRDKIIAQVKNSQSKRKDEIQSYNKSYTEVNRDKKNLYTKEWRLKNPTYAKEWAKSNKDYYNNWHKQKYSTDILYKLNKVVRNRIYVELPKKSKKSCEYLGCSYENYATYLESLFDNKMNWDNYGEYWEIDHIYPLSKGGSLHYTNTQPLTKIENREKSNRVLWH